MKFGCISIRNNTVNAAGKRIIQDDRSPLLKSALQKDLKESVVLTILAKEALFVYREGFNCLYFCGMCSSF